SAELEEISQKYFHALIDEEWEKAESCWLPYEVEISRRLGISFTGIKAKYDCTSPLVNSSSSIRKDVINVQSSFEYIDDTTTKMTTYLITAKDTMVTQYYVLNSEGRWWICSALYPLTRDWKKISTRFFNIYFSDSTLINDYALDELDLFVESVNRKFRISKSRIDHLKQNKINYYLCNEQQMKQITGYSAQGMTSFPFDAIISQHLPHTHEITHLMINYAFEELPLFTLPSIQEGLACCIGGRWGKSPQVIFYWGNVSMEMNPTAINDIMTSDGFYRGSASSDASYALSSLFTEALIDRFGFQQLKTFYLELSGDNNYVNSLTLDEIKLKSNRIFGISWPEIQTDYQDLANQNKFCGIIPEIHVSSDPELELVSDNLNAQIWDLDDSYFIRIKLLSDISNGVILIVDESIDLNPFYKSKFFNKYIPNIKYNGEMYGIQFSPAEVGLYNYYTNCLLAKYVLGFTPSDKYWNPEKHEISFKIDKSLLNHSITDFNIRLVEIGY
ncbi:MAG: hypothetical protein GY855_04265, partial [candidate division Zixibacteria bacterium]|nr:hypothetical protein [candidate division Zixibacteria bacterium]